MVIVEGDTGHTIQYNRAPEDEQTKLRAEDVEH